MPTPAILGSATLNYQLTAYAQGLWNDLGDVIKLAERLGANHARARRGGSIQEVR